MIFHFQTIARINNSNQFLLLNLKDSKFHILLLTPKGKMFFILSPIKQTLSKFKSLTNLCDF